LILGDWHRLELKILPAEDTYRDMGRVTKNSRGKDVKEGHVYRVRCKNGKSVLLAIRGMAEGNILQVDNETRRKLGLEAARHYDFKFERVGWLGTIIWLCNATDPVQRIVGNLGVLSFALGVLSLALGVLSVWPMIAPGLGALIHLAHVDQAMGAVGRLIGSLAGSVRTITRS